MKQKLFVISMFFLFVPSLVQAVERIEHSEINGFKWVENKTSRAYRDGRRDTDDSIDVSELYGKEIFGSLKRVFYLCADKDDPGVFFIQRPYSRKSEDGFYTSKGERISSSGLCYVPGKRSPLKNQRFKMRGKYYTVFPTWIEETGERYGLIDDAGRIIISPEYKQISPTIGDDPRMLNGVLAIEGYSQPYGLITLNGDVIIEPNESNYIKIEGDLISAKTPQGYSLLDLDGNYKVKNAGFINHMKDNTYEVKIKEGGYGLLSSNGEWIISPEKGYKYINPFEGKDMAKFYMVKASNDRYGILDSKGEILLPCEFEDISYIGGNYYRFKSGGFWGVVDDNSKIIIPTSRGYTSIGEYSSIQKTIPFKKTGYYGECNNLGKEIALHKDTSVTQTKGSTEKESASNSGGTNNSNGSKYIIKKIIYNDKDLPIKSTGNYININKDTIEVILGGTVTTRIEITTKGEKTINGITWKGTQNGSPVEVTMILWDENSNLVIIGSYGYVIDV